MGADTGPDSDIARLIEEYKVGGVLVSPGDGNFTNAPDAPTQVAKLSEQLQSLALGDEGPGFRYSLLWRRTGMVRRQHGCALA